MSTRRFIASTLMIGVMAVLAFGHRRFQQEKTAAPAQTEAGAGKLRQQLEFGVGQKLAAALSDNSSIALATIVNVGPPVKEKDAADQHTASFRKVRLRIDEWLLRGEKEKDQVAEVELEQITPPPAQKFNQGPWTIWNNVDVACRKQIADRVLQREVCESRVSR